MSKSLEEQLDEARAEIERLSAEHEAYVARVEQLIDQPREHSQKQELSIHLWRGLCQELMNAIGQAIESQNAGKTFDFSPVLRLVVEATSSSAGRGEPDSWDPVQMAAAKQDAEAQTNDKADE